MKTSSAAATILGKINAKTKLGDLRNIAKQLKTEHELALELWSTGQLQPRLLAILIMDNKQVSADLTNQLIGDMYIHPLHERNQLVDWLMANQLVKNKKTIALIESWEHSASALQRRIFWYYQGRLRWMGQPSPANTPALLAKIETDIAKEVPEVQWAMNFTAGWIGIYDKQYRNRCITLGEKTGLYKDDKVSKGCTPNYLPAFIKIESSKRNL
ncbi:DNA alkylation repair protein [Chitinophaga sedimenti]|uniref:DNA alkylation repair protein n=1 Tax=Chitinophaga sedimenti TaxID=2033606 RepID=UPI00200507A3|nr:DNA alkylation repair protein [Chitinophaga sedimenti]MCK7554062.1 DNA alkylation repair protein [Chitinophaga sedimenti]